LKDIAMFVRLLSTLGALAATAATVAVATPAHAQDEARSATVSLAALDLARPADAARLDQRLQAAARQVCGPDEGLDVRARRQIAACEKNALLRARADVQLALRGNGSTKVALVTK
jgi:UrcA family protein